MTHVDLHVHPCVRRRPSPGSRSGGAASRALASPRRPRSAPGLAATRAAVLRRAPLARDPLDVLPVLLLTAPGGVIRRPEHARIRADETSAHTRSGYVAAKKTLIGPPSDAPSRAARSDPTASITARTSSMRVSSVAAPLTGSDMPWPRLSKRIRRENDARSPIERGHARHLPSELDVRREGRDVHEVERAVAHHLVRDRDVSAARVAGLGQHRRIVAHGGSSGERSSTSSPRSCARTWSASTVSATGVSSRNSSRASKSATSARIAVS